MPAKLNLRYLITVVLILAGVVAYGQVADTNAVIKIKGTTTDENGTILPRAGIYSFMLQRGYASDSSGVFSINSIAGDTVMFISPGYKPTLLTIPSEPSFNTITTEVRMVKDTISLEEVVILPFRTYREFKNSVTREKDVTPEVENMIFNVKLVRRQLYDQLTATPGEGYRFAVQHISNDCYTKGQLH